LSAARGDLINYTTAVEADSTRTFLVENVSSGPMLVNIGSLSGFNTYEFIVNGSPSYPDGSDALLGRYSGGQSEAIKFEQH
jgi:hypothetical protein